MKNYKDILNENINSLGNGGLNDKQMINTKGAILIKINSKHRFSIREMLLIMQSKQIKKSHINLINTSEGYGEIILKRILEKEKLKQNER